jgi:hypothetical protein
VAEPRSRGLSGPGRDGVKSFGPHATMVGERHGPEGKPQGGIGMGRLN